MFLTVLTSVLLTIWLLLCGGLFLYRYLVEVVFDLPNGQTPYTAHAQLKLFIERLIRDAQDLPKLTRNDQYDVPSEDNNRTYEDLLSTAIINKVITNYQNNPNRPSSSANSVSSRLSSSSRTRDDNIFFGEETLDSKWKTTDLETSSVSSLESWIQSDSNLGSSKYVDKVTLTIRQNIDDVHNTDSEEDEEGDNDSTYFRTKSSLLSDDDPNWHLQKRQFVGTNSPVPVPMLVPDPTGDAKVLIGDKEIDETSDLSDIASDYGDTENVPEMKNILIESKTVIGGKNLLDSFTASDGELSADSGVKEDKYFDGYSSNNPTEDGDYIVQAINIAKADKSVDDDNVEDASIISLYSNTEKDTEYTEKYATLPRTIMKPDSNFNSEKENLSVEETKHKHSNEDHDDYEYINGSYSKKEKDKWKHPIKMENNPYSKENIEKRLNRSNSSVSSLFGSDYYKRQASAPAGTKKRQEEYQNSNTTATQDDHIYIATPVNVDHDVEEEEDIIPKLKSPETSVSEITSDSDMSYNVYDVENSQIFSKPANENPKETFTKLEDEVYVVANPVIVNYNRQSNSYEKVKQNDNLILYETSRDINENAKKEKDINLIMNKNLSEKLPVVPNGFVKTAPVPKQRTVFKRPETNLRRFLSQPNLDCSSFDAPPTVIKRKKDNTLISKIYLDPNVRKEGLTKRDFIPDDFGSQENLLKTQMGVDMGMAKQRKSFSPALKQNFEIPPSKSSKSQSPIVVSSDDDRFEIQEVKTETLYSSSDYSEMDKPKNEEDNETFVRKGQKEIDPIIDGLQGFVADKLSKFSVSQPNLFKETKGVDSDDENEEEEQNRTLSVRELKKKFEKYDAQSKVGIVHSITARSVTRDKLRL